MPRFHFNVHDGVSRLDRDGTELANWHEARTEGLRLAGAILKDDAERLKFGQDWRMEVTDAAGLILFRLDFSVMETAAVPKQNGSGAAAGKGTA